MILGAFPRAWILIATAQLASALVGAAWAQTTGLPAASPEAREVGIRETQAGRYREGYALLLPWVVSNPEDHEARLDAAWSAAFLGRTYEAADLLAGLNEENPRVQLLWGKLLLDKRDPQGAIGVLEPLARAAPAELDLEIRRLLAKAFMAVGQADQAVALLAGRVDGDPALALELAQAMYESGDVEGAIELLQPDAKAALDRLRSDESALGSSLSVSLVYEYGLFLVTSAHHGEAIPFLEAAVQLAPNCKQCWQQLAQAYVASGRRREAQSAQQRFQEILQAEAPMEERQRQEALDQRDPTGRVLREAREAFDDGRRDEALAMLEAEAQLRAEDPRILRLAAEILEHEDL